MSRTIDTSNDLRFATPNAAALQSAQVVAGTTHARPRTTSQADRHARGHRAIASASPAPVSRANRGKLVGVVSHVADGCSHHQIACQRTGFVGSGKAPAPQRRRGQIDDGGLDGLAFWLPHAPRHQHEAPARRSRRGNVSVVESNFCCNSISPSCKPRLWS